MPAKPKRPGQVIFVAVVLIILGCWSLLGGVCGGGFTAFAAMQPDPGGPAQPGDPFAAQRFLAKEIPGYTATIFVLLFFNMLFGIGELIAGIGLLRMSSAARTLAIVLTVLKLFFSMASNAYNLVYVLPANDKFIREHLIVAQGGQPPPFDLGAVTQASAMIGVGCGIAFQLTIALLILIFLNTASTKAAFAAAASGAPPADDDRPRARYEGYDDDDDGGRPAKPRRNRGDTGITGRPE